MTEYTAVTKTSNVDLPNDASRTKVSAFVISYNRQDLIQTCLKGLAFADEVILVDKSSTDRTVEAAKGLADRVVVVPWSPTVEETRRHAESLCTHDWIVFLGDDECLNVPAIEFLDKELQAPSADVYYLPLKHHIMGVFDADAYYWPEHHVRCFRRGSLEFKATVHAGIGLKTANVKRIPIETGIAIEHLSHSGVAQWIEKSNRYTSRVDRTRMIDLSEDVVAFAHDSIDRWVARSRNVHPGSYAASAALLRASYDIIDRLKTWEEESGIDGLATFRQCCVDLDQAYSNLSCLQARRGTSIFVSEQEGGPAIDTSEPAKQATTTGMSSGDRLDQDALERTNEGLKSIVKAIRDQSAKLKEATRAQAAQLQSELDTVRLEARQSSAALTTATDNAAKLQSEIVAVRREARQSSAALTTATDNAAKLRSELSAAQQESRRSAAERDHERDRFARQRLAHKNALEKLSDLHQRLLAIENSTTWRATAFVRSLASRNPAIAANLGRGMRLTLWTVNGELKQRLYERKRRIERLKTHVDRSATPPGRAVTSVAEEILESKSRSTEISERAIKRASKRIAHICIPTSSSPTVSIIIPTFGQIAYTRNCLASISVNPPNVAFEVILMDDCYNGSDAAQLSQSLEGVRVVRNDENLGFLLTCNAAAQQALGQYLFFLNNDTEITAGSIDALTGLLDRRPDIGMTGAKLIYPDGSLQEAGGIVWNDASAWNWGRGSDPGRPEYNYVREVDYISGAAVMVRRSTFEKLGGFDVAFAPAYYEDTDLAFRIRAEGLKVVYEPRSVVIHFEGKSHGVDASSGVKAHQVTNAKLMLSRWGETLKQQHFVNGTHVLRARDRARDRKVALVVDHYIPEPDRDAGSRSTMGILSSLMAANWDVKFWPQNRAYHETYTGLLQDMGIEVIDGRWPGTLEAWMQENGNALDHVLVMRPTVARDLVGSIVNYTGARLAFYGHDLHFARMRREATLKNDANLAGLADEMEILERSLWHEFDTVIYPSAEEAETVNKLEPSVNARAIIGFCRDRFKDHSSATGGSTILFVAGFGHPPNVDAAQYLVQDILPIVREGRPDTTVLLVGSNPSPDVRALKQDGVAVTGWVSEERLLELYGEARVAVVPLRFGAGVKGKVIEALGEGVPLVTTPTGAQGIFGIEDIVPVHEDAKSIAASILSLLNDDAAWLRQSEAQVGFARMRFSSEAMRESVIAALEGSVSGQFRAGVQADQIHGKGDDANLQNGSGSPAAEPMLPNESISVAAQQSSTSPLMGVLPAQAANGEDAIYERQVRAQIAQHSDTPIHDMPRMADWLNDRFLSPRLTEVMGAAGVTDVYARELSAAAVRTGIDVVVSLGAGDATEEMRAALAAQRLGLAPFRIVCLELSDILVERGRAAIEKAGLSHIIEMRVADLNVPLFLSAPVAGFVIHHALHHIVSLELLIDEIKAKMHHEGSFVTFDMIGRNGHMRWPEVLGPLRELWPKLPQRLRHDRSQGRVDLWFNDWDCSIEGFEGIRSQDILPLLVRNFKFEKFMTWGGLTDVFVDRRFGYNFNPDNDLDRKFIASVQDAEDRMIDTGVMFPTAMGAVMRQLTSHTCPNVPSHFRDRTPQKMVRLPDASLRVPSLAACGISLAGFPPIPQQPVILEHGDIVGFGSVDPVGKTMLRWGWAEPEDTLVWAFGLSSSVGFEIDGVANAISVRTLGYVAPGGSPQVLSITINGVTAVTVVHDVMGHVSETRLPLPRSQSGDQFEVEFRASNPRRPDRDGGDDRRPLSFALLSLAVE